MKRQNRRTAQGRSSASAACFPMFLSRSGRAITNICCTRSPTTTLQLAVLEPYKARRDPSAQGESARAKRTDHPTTPRVHRL